jgi:hypothetical protein
MERKHLVAGVVVLGFATAIYGLSQIRAYSCGDFNRIQLEYASTLSPLMHEAYEVDYPKACKILEDKIFPLIERQKQDLSWFNKCWMGFQKTREANDFLIKIYGPLHDDYQKNCLPLGT